MAACAWQWILLELMLMSSSAADAAEGCVIVDTLGFPALNDHEPEYDCWPWMKGLHRSRLGPDSSVHLRPMTVWVPLDSAAASALVMEPPESLLPAI